jgi:tRNA 2-thiouridine synthesizing protein A
MPVLLMEAALRRAAPGARLRVTADDPIASIDIPHFCREGGHLAERLPDDDGACVFLVTAGGNSAA